jgi:hypothetical protein
MRFVKDHVTSLFHVPLDMGRKVTRNMTKIRSPHADPKEQLMLSDDRSAFGSDLFLAVDGDVPDAEMTTLSGTFRTRVYDGSFKEDAMTVAQPFTLDLLAQDPAGPVRKVDRATVVAALERMRDPAAIGTR